MSRILDISGTELKHNDRIVVNTENIDMEKATIESSDFGFVVVYDNNRINGKISYDKHRTNKNRRCFKVLDRDLS